MPTTIERRDLLRGAVAVLGAGAAAAILDSCTRGGSTAAPGPQSRSPLSEGTLSPVTDLAAPVQENLREAMRAAVEQAQPIKWKFGATLVDVESGSIVARAANDTVSGDPSLHAEVHVLRKGGLAGTDLSRTVLVTTAESCPMCASCAVWSRVAGVAYGTPIEYLVEQGFSQIRISQPQVVAAGFVPMPVVGNVHRSLTDPLYSSGPPSA